MAKNKNILYIPDASHLDIISELAQSKVSGKKTRKRVQYLGKRQGGVIIEGSLVHSDEGGKIYEMPVYGSIPGSNFRVFAVHRKGKQPVVFKVPRFFTEKEKYHTKDRLKKDQKSFSIAHSLTTTGKYLRTEWVDNLLFKEMHHGDKLRVDVFVHKGDKNLGEYAFSDSSELKRAFKKIVNDSLRFFVNGIQLDIKPENYTVYRAQGKNVDYPLIDLDTFATTWHNWNKHDHQRLGQKISRTMFDLMNHNKHLLSRNPELPGELMKIAKEEVEGCDDFEEGDKHHVANELDWARRFMKPHQIKKRILELHKEGHEEKEITRRLWGEFGSFNIHKAIGQSVRGVINEEKVRSAVKRKRKP